MTLSSNEKYEFARGTLEAISAMGNYDGCTPSQMKAIADNALQKLKEAEKK